MVIKLRNKILGYSSYAISPQFQSKFLPEFITLAATLAKPKPER
jgi:hypothetical protein